MMDRPTYLVVIEGKVVTPPRGVALSVRWIASLSGTDLESPS